jgi:quinol monooxygenase YgiN
MIREIAIITIAATQSAAFEAAFPEARRVIVQAPGCGEVSLRRCIETPGRYVLLVDWPSVQAHMDFRASPLFADWRRIIGPFFVTPPLVEHYELAG